MALAAELIDRLKTELRARGLTYAHVAEHLELSESSVKRLFRERDMSLTRLESICALINTDIADLCTRIEQSRRNLDVLSLDQEKMLVGDEQLFLIAVHLLFGWSFDQIMQTFELDVHQAQQHLTRLDKMKIIELLPENRVRLLLSTDFQWIPGGPIQQFFERTVQGNFFESDFSAEGELRLVLNGWISIDSTKAFHDNIRRLAREFEVHKDFDRQTPAGKRRGTSLVIAIRPWALGIFEKYRKDAHAETPANRK